LGKWKPSITNASRIVLALNLPWSYRKGIDYTSCMQASEQQVNPRLADNTNAGKPRNVFLSNLSWLLLSLPEDASQPCGPEVPP
jgi:hypothetical protein